VSSRQADSMKHLTQFEAAKSFWPTTAAGNLSIDLGQKNSTIFVGVN